MKKLIIIMLLFFIIFIGASYAQDNNEIKVESAYFKLPDGYSEGELNKDGDINLTNGTNSIFISDCHSDDLDVNLNDYVDNLEMRNFTFSTSKFNIDGVDGYKVSVGNNSNTTHYWFKIGEKVYTIYSWDVNNKLDDLVDSLIKSVHVN